MDLKKKFYPMKKLFTIILAFVGFGLQAQEEKVFTIDAKAISAQEMPKEVMKSIQQDFPGNDVVKYYLLAADKVDPEWAVVMEDNLEPTDQVDHYTVMLKGKKGGYIYGLYNKEGDLQKMKVLANDLALPPTISKAATSGNYEGYAIKSDKYVKMVDKKSNREYVEVVVGKDRDTKKLYFDTQGNFIKEKQ
jgi:predicted RND superfamily exporter protein